MLKAKLAKLRVRLRAKSRAWRQPLTPPPPPQREILDPKTAGGGGKGEGFDVTKCGDSRVGLVGARGRREGGGGRLAFSPLPPPLVPGFPSVGKSTLLTKLTGTFSEVASYEFTTVRSAPTRPPLQAPSLPLTRPCSSPVSPASSATEAPRSSCWTCRESLRGRRTARAAAGR